MHLVPQPDTFLTVWLSQAQHTLYGSRVGFDSIQGKTWRVCDYTGIPRRIFIALILVQNMQTETSPRWDISEESIKETKASMALHASPWMIFQPQLARILNQMHGWHGQGVAFQTQHANTMGTDYAGMGPSIVFP